MSRYYNLTLQAYEEAQANPGLNLGDFFDRLARKTGNIVGFVGNTYRPIWENKEGYPYDIHLVHLFFSYMAPTHADLILSWYLPDGIPEHHLKNHASIAVFVIGALKSVWIYWVDTPLVQGLHRVTGFTQDEWNTLHGIVKQVVQSFGVG